MKSYPRWKKVGWSAGTFTFGATVGSLLGLLFAPASGRATRKRIGLQFRSLERSTARQIQQAKKLLAKKADRLRETTVEKLGNTREWLVDRVSNGRHHPLPRRVVHRS